MIYQIIWVLALLVVGYIIGTYLERKHYRSILKREEALRSLPVVASKYLPEDGVSYQQTLVMGNVTISVDYFKRFLATLHNFFGGRVTSYESLLDRARREAMLRMKSQAASQQASLVLNVKYETASIYKGSGSNIGSVEVLAYGTALIPKST
ncbi:YbjQ family protein [Leucothrix pacifica]|uniref:YbjQ family protein n=1 Tax=Leucothrix pacifica TaxID=1247513 RepID=A0A317CPF6_9GAMM|nr:heavy metal-binding domain-containing protein [Leucothrix pacifica]PWR00108.1 hypothetical protein DKW60_02930 [Leucothrix pacifica]